MSKTILRSASLMLAIVLTLGNFISGGATSQNLALMPERTVNLAFFYKPPTNSDAATLAGFGSIVLTAGDETFRDQLIANGYGSTIPQYLRAEAIMDPGTCTTAPYKNQVAYKAGDFCDISTNHPDWFLLDANGNRIRVAGSNYYRMDPGNAGWRNFFVTRLLEMQQLRGWSGLFLDNLEAGLNQIQRDGATSPRYPDTTSYRAAVRGFAQYVYQNYAVPYNRPIMANIIARSNTDEAVWFDYMQYMHGAMQERWAVDWSDTGYLSESNWNADMLLAERTQSQGKYIILVAPGTQADTNRQQFAFASYLLISNGKAAFRYSNSSFYREVWMYENYRVQLGSALGARYQAGTTWRRDFTNGYVLVDPINHTSTISSTPPASPTSTTVPTQVLTSTTTAIPTQPATFTATSVPTQPATLTATALPTQPATFTSTAISIPTQTPTLVAGNAIYNDRDPAFSYSRGWTDVNDPQSYNGQFKRTTRIGSSVTLSFSGQRFSVIYKAGPQFGKMDIFVDGALVYTLDQNAPVDTFQQRWSYGGTLSAGPHQLRLVYSSGSSNGRVSLDAVSIP